MKFFIAWEHYSTHWSLIEKGYHFIEVTDPFLIDIVLGEHLERLAKSKAVELKYIVPVSCQPMPSVREENEHWRASNQKSDELDPLYNQAVAFVVEKRRASISGLQRQLRIGYNRVAILIEQMESQGIVSPANRDGSRELI